MNRISHRIPQPSQRPFRRASGPGRRRSAAGRSLALTLSLLFAAIAATPGEARAQRRGPSFARLGFELTGSSVYDSNLSRSVDRLESWGWTAGGATTLHLERGATALSLEYGVDAHRFGASDRWDRVTQEARATFAGRISDALRVDVMAEHGTGRASEDREIGKEYAVFPRLDVLPDSRSRIRIRGGYRIRDYGDLGGRNARNRLIGVDYRIGASGGAGVEIGTRYEVNVTEEARNRFYRWRHRARFTAPLGRASDIAIALEQQSRRYPERLLSMEPVDQLSGEARDLLAGYTDSGIPGGGTGTDPRTFPRHDQIWKPSLEITYGAGPVEIELGYEFEARLSNDLRRGYDGHTLTLGTRVRN
ncbi:MAG TPA: hypothetical protein VMM79_09385 [Longimicrobiales bacterium]|nr:hypothetical protein [Longimicrobiales bacterium]